MAHWLTCLHWFVACKGSWIRMPCAIVEKFPFHLDLEVVVPSCLEENSLWLFARSLEVKLKGQWAFPNTASGFRRSCNLKWWFRVTEFSTFFSPSDCSLSNNPSVSEKGEVISTHYKLFPADIRDIPKLDSVIRMAEMDPRWASFLHYVYL